MDFDFVFILENVKKSLQKNKASFFRFRKCEKQIFFDSYKNKALAYFNFLPKIRSLKTSIPITMMINPPS